jgi:hypothetical protein
VREVIVPGEVELLRLNVAREHVHVRGFVFLLRGREQRQLLRRDQHKLELLDAADLLVVDATAHDARLRHERQVRAAQQVEDAVDGVKAHAAAVDRAEVARVVRGQRERRRRVDAAARQQQAARLLRVEHDQCIVLDHELKGGAMRRAAVERGHRERRGRGDGDRPARE